MPLLFASVCDLLDESRILSMARKANSAIVESWFTRFRTQVDAHDTDLVALLSTLLPEKRSDRVYCIQAPTLEKIVGRGLSLGSSRKLELQRYREGGSGVDLAECVEHILRRTPTHILPVNRVTVEEIDQLLDGLASRIKWSSPSIRASQTPLAQRDRVDLERIYSRLTATEAKWLTRLVLKSYAPLVLNEHLILRLCDPLLPSVLKVRQDFSDAVHYVQSARAKLLPNAGCRAWHRKDLLSNLKPKVGIKVSRQHWAQARSIKHCLGMGNGRMSVEHKVDGEYCQVHIDLSKGMKCVQIFSKSGKDSTEDREGLHSIIRDSLRVYQPGCKFSKNCILEGELVVYNDLIQKVLPFHKIRNHVTRRGRFLNTDQDSLPQAHEHLMIVYYDLLLLDNKSFIRVVHSERFHALKELIDCRKGWAEIVPRATIDFGHSLAASSLRNAFARIIVNKEEGLVLKPDEPYFDFNDPDRPRSGLCIKMKKEYIGAFGDVGDFAAVGAGYDPVKAQTYGIPGLKWTHFYIGCLENQDEVKKYSSRPIFKVINTVQLNETLLKLVLKSGNPRPVPRDSNDDIELRIAPGVELGPRMAVVFANPMVFDLRCFSFEKGGTTGFWSLRFPVVSKVHFDRDFTDTLSFSELQAMAVKATQAPSLPDSQENLLWIAKLEGADPRGIAIDTVSQQTVTSTATPSPSRSTLSASQRSSLSPIKLRVAQRSTILKSKIDASPATVHQPAQPFITPPTSSPNAFSSPHSSLLQRSSKRPPQPQTLSRQSHRRSKGEQQKVPLTSSLLLAPTEQSREPLAEIDAASQISSSFSGKANMTPRKNDMISCVNDMVALECGNEQNSPPQDIVEIMCQDHISQGASPPNNLDLFGTSSSPYGSNGIHVSTASQTSGEEGTVENVPAIRPDQMASHQDLKSATVPAHACIYAGEKCQVTNTLFLLAPGLDKFSSDLRIHFTAHGIKEPVTDLEYWLSDVNRPLEKNVILLVDYESSSLPLNLFIENIRTLRSKLPASRHEEALMIYDWRVLGDISRSEDPSTSKSYSGFRDPRRRWFVSVI